LLACCQSDLDRQLRGKTSTKRQLLTEDKTAGLALPNHPFDCLRKTSCFVNSQSLIRFDTNDYSVPVDYAHRPVVIHTDWRQVRLYHDHRLIAEHARCWEHEKQVFNPLHYLRLLQRKPGSLDHAQPLMALKLPACFGQLRRILEAKHPEGIREYIRVLRLLEDHRIDEVALAIRRALQQRIMCCDAIAQFLPHTEPWEQTTFRLDGREHLRYVHVNDNDVLDYGQLLAGGVA
jgi:hypothetical protein